MFIIFSDILIDEQIFFSPEVKTSVIISNKHGIYELPHGVAERLKTWEIRKYQKNSKTSYNYSLVPSLSAKMKILSILAKNS